MTTATTTKRPRVVLPCSDCGTLGGKVPARGVSPVRLNGQVFGLGLLCSRCYSRHFARAAAKRKRLGNLCPRLRAKRRAERIRNASDSLRILSPCPCGTRRYRFAQTCDLCGVSKRGVMFAADEFDLEGKICRECRDELRDERAVNRLADLASKPYVSPIRDTHGRRTIVLPVLTGGFTADELTPRAACRLMVVQFDRRVSA